MKFGSFFQSKKTQYNLGIALSGGGVKGFAHVGALQALTEAGVRPDIIAGTSAGSLAGSLFADGYSPEEILKLFDDKGFKHFAEFTMWKGGLFKSDKFQHFLNHHLRAKKFEDLKIPLKIVTTNLENGKTVIFDKGPIIPAILASCAFPIVFTPVKIENQHYIDGGLLKNFPVSIIKNECKYTIGINITPITQEEYRNSMLYVAERTFHYASIANTIPDRKLCDILVEPKKVSKFRMFNLDHIDEIYQIGYDSLRESFDKKKYTEMWDKIKQANKS